MLLMVLCCCCWTACAASSESLTFVQRSRLLICSCGSSTFRRGRHCLLYSVFMITACAKPSAGVCPSSRVAVLRVPHVPGRPVVRFRAFPPNRFCMRRAEVPRSVWQWIRCTYSNLWNDETSNLLNLTYRICCTSYCLTGLHWSWEVRPSKCEHTIKSIRMIDCEICFCVVLCFVYVLFLVNKSVKNLAN